MSIEEHFQNLVTKAQLFCDMHHHIILAFDNSVDSVKTGESKVEHVTQFIQDSFKFRFSEYFSDKFD